MSFASLRCLKTVDEELSLAYVIHVDSCQIKTRPCCVGCALHISRSGARFTPSGNDFVECSSQNTCLAISALCAAIMVHFLQQYKGIKESLASVYNGFWLLQTIKIHMLYTKSALLNKTSRVQRLEFHHLTINNEIAAGMIQSRPARPLHLQCSTADASYKMLWSAPPLPVLGGWARLPYAQALYSPPSLCKKYPNDNKVAWYIAK